MGRNSRQSTTPVVYLITKQVLPTLRKLLTKHLPQYSGQVMIKANMGEYGNLQYIRPPIIGEIAEAIKKKGGKPFLFDMPISDIVYENQRSTPKLYLDSARRHGFTQETIGCPVEVSDESVPVKTKGAIRKFNVAKRIKKLDGLIIASHAKGHPDTGFAGAIKNIGMGLINKKSKQRVHLKGWPIFGGGKCGQCQKCVEACQWGVIKKEKEKPVFTYAKGEATFCMGCDACVKACPKGFLKPKVSSFQASVVEACQAVLSFNPKMKIYCISVLMGITPRCDCFPLGELEQGLPFCPDIGLLVSKDLVAIDQASVDLIRKQTRKDIFYKINKLEPDELLSLSEKVGLGTRKYKLIEV